jgi:hypothetical protein
MTKPSQITASDRSSLDVAYWTAQLAQAPALLELASDRPRPAVRIGAAGTVSLVLTVELTAALRRFSERHGATLFMTFVAGWSVLLSRLTAQTDVVIGTPIVRGPRTASDPPADSVVNTVALRVRGTCQ